MGHGNQRFATSILRSMALLTNGDFAAKVRGMRA